MDNWRVAPWNLLPLVFCAFISLGWSQVKPVVPDSDSELVQEAWDKKKRYFIAVTVNKYLASNADADLPFAAVDGEKVKEFLTKAGYDDLGSLTDTTAIRDNFIESLKKINGKSENSRVVVYYSGHGVVDSEGKNLWLQMYGQTVLGEHHGIAASEIVDTARGGGQFNGELAIILDSCFSGQGVLSSGLTLKDLGPRTSIFTSSTDIQESHKIEVDASTQMSAFTYSLFKALGDDWNQVDPNNSGFIGYKELHLYSIKALRSWKEQKKVAGLMHPLLLSNEEMIFTYDKLRDKHQPSLYRDYILGDALADALEPTQKLMSLTGLQNVALKYPVPSIRARRIASLISHPPNSYIAALKAIAEGRFSDADSNLSSARLLRVPKQQVARARAWNEFYSRNYADAVASYNQALALSDSAHKRSLLLEAADAAQLAGHPDRASVLYTQVLNSGIIAEPSDPLAAVAWNNLGTAHALLGNAHLAKQDFSSSLRFGGRLTSLDVATTYDNLGYIVAFLGDKQEASRLYGQAQMIRGEDEIKAGDYSSWQIDLATGTLRSKGGKGYIPAVGSSSGTRAISH